MAIERKRHAANLMFHSFNWDDKFISVGIHLPRGNYQIGVGLWTHAHTIWTTQQYICPKNCDELANWTVVIIIIIMNECTWGIVDAIEAFYKRARSRAYKCHMHMADFAFISPFEFLSSRSFVSPPFNEFVTNMYYFTLFASDSRFYVRPSLLPMLWIALDWATQNENLLPTFNAFRRFFLVHVFCWSYSTACDNLVVYFSRRMCSTVSQSAIITVYPCSMRSFPEFYCT